MVFLSIFLMTLLAWRLGAFDEMRMHRELESFDRHVHLDMDEADWEDRHQRFRGSHEEFTARKRKTSLVNKHLKSVQKILGFETSLTTHVARHSFGHVLDAAGWRTRDIQRLFSHSDVQTTQVYLDSLRTRRFDRELGIALQIDARRD